MKLALLGLAASAALLITGETLAADGKEVYNKSCAACHAALSPKLGDKAAWEPRLKQGNDALVAAVVKGKGTMPAKGGNASLSEADIKAAVEYMVAALK
jgi:cytochrome c5